MTVLEILSRLQQEKSKAIQNGAPPLYIHGFEAAMAIIRIATREGAK